MVYDPDIVIVLNPTLLKNVLVTLFPNPHTSGVSASYPDTSLL